MNTFNMRHPSGPECARYADRSCLSSGKERSAVLTSVSARASRHLWLLPGATGSLRPAGCRVVHLHGPFRADRARRR